MAAKRGWALFTGARYPLWLWPSEAGRRCLVYEECCRQICSSLFQPCGCETWWPPGRPQPCLWHGLTRVVDRVEETDPEVRLFWGVFTSSIPSTEFWVTEAELMNHLTSLGGKNYNHVLLEPPVTLPLFYLSPPGSRYWRSSLCLPGFGSRSICLLYLGLGLVFHVYLFQQELAM